MISQAKEADAHDLGSTSILGAMPAARELDKQLRGLREFFRDD